MAGRPRQTNIGSGYGMSSTRGLELHFGGMTWVPQSRAGNATRGVTTRRRTAKGGLRNAASQQAAATTTQTPRRGRKPKNPIQA